MSERRHRYPGPESFRDDDLDRRLFQGRDADGSRLLYLTLAEEVVVLYAKSGTGKTSLINARLLEPLRERQFLPVVARVGDPRLTPAAAICDAVRDAATKHGFELQDGERSSLLAYFRTLEVWKGDVLLTPVVVLDQFEELFTVRTAEVREAFARELAALRGRVDPGPGLEEGRVPLKLVLSLREDAIGELEELSASMPDVLQHRFRIGPLSEADVKAAIVEPARRTDPELKTPPFTWDESTVGRLVDFLHQRRIAGRTLSASHVALFQLQLICRHVEDLVATRQAAGQPLLPIDYDRDIGGDEGARRIVREFYERQLAALAADHPVKSLRRLCEEGLITAAGRRAILDEVTIEQKYGLGANALGALARRHLVRAEPRGDEKRYELSHDVLVAPIVEAREERRARSARRTLLGIGSALLALFLTAFFVGRSAVFQEWLSVREGQELAQELRGTGDGAISAWSLALAWGGYGARAQADAEEIEEPSTKAVAMVRIARALAAIPDPENRPLVEKALSNARDIAKRQWDERLLLLAEVAITAEGLGLATLAESAWSEVGGLEPDASPAILEGAESLRRQGIASTPGLDALLLRVRDDVLVEIRAAVRESRSPDALEALQHRSTLLFKLLPSAEVAPLTAALEDLLSARVPPHEQAPAYLEVARELTRRGLLDPARRFIEHAERRLPSLPRNDVVGRLRAFAYLARLLDATGQEAEATAAARRLRGSLDRDAARLDDRDLRVVLDDLEAALASSSVTQKPPSADLAATMTAARRLLIRRVGPDPHSADLVAEQHWRLGDRDQAIRVIESLPPEGQASSYGKLLTIAGAEGRSVLERALEAALKVPDPRDRGPALATVVGWFVQHAPSELDRALELVSREDDSRIRVQTLNALVKAAEKPAMAERVARFVAGELTPPTRVEPPSSPGVPPPGAASEQTASAGKEPDADLLNAVAGERLARLRLLEAALTAVAVEGKGLIADAFAIARTEADDLGSSRSEWLGRLGVVAARGGDLATARRLAFDIPERERRLAVLTSIVAVRAAHRAPGLRDRIQAELLALPGSGGGF